MLAGSLSEFRKERDVAAKHRLHGGADCPENRPGPDDNTAYHAKIVHDSESRHVEAGRCHVGRNVCCLRTDDGGHESRFLRESPRLQYTVVIQFGLWRRSSPTTRRPLVSFPERIAGTFHLLFLAASVFVRR